jgi:hypothetical protein
MVIRSEGAAETELEDRGGIQRRDDLADHPSYSEHPLKDSLIRQATCGPCGLRRVVP